MSSRWQLACGWLTLFVVGTDLFIISPLLPAIASEFDHPASVTGVTVTLFSLTYLLSAPLLGQLADRAGRRRVLILCLLVFAVANLLTGVATSFTWLLASRVVAGAAAAGVTPSIYAGVGEAAPPGRRATWLAIAVSGLLLALSVGAPAGTLIASSWGWRAPFLVLGMLSLALIAANTVVWPLHRNSYAVVGSAAAPGPASMTLRLLPTVLWATGLYGVYTYLGVWLTDAGLSSPEIARAIGCYGVGALAGTLLGGHVADRCGTRATMLTSLAGLAVCLSVLGVGVGTGWMADVVLLVASIFAQFFFPAQQAALTWQFPQRRAFILAMNNSALFLGISLGSLLGGQAMARSGFGADATMGAAIAGVALMVVAANGGSKRLRQVPSSVP
jgi:MFS transporter, DHA1 family, putative efflux transporter